VKEGWVYSLDKNGNILRMASAVIGSSQAWDYSYDGRGRLVGNIGQAPIMDFFAFSVKYAA